MSVRAEPERVGVALDAAAIRPERRGRARLSRLTQPERELYRWLLQRFAMGEPPSGESIRAAAADLGLGPDDALAVFAREDLVHVDDGGRPTVAYPFSARDRGHRVLIDGGREVQAMCAIDALGIASMLEQPIEVSSRDPISGGEVRVQLTPGEQPTWQPSAAVVLAGAARCDGPSFGGCCDVLNFFETLENAQRYLLEHPEITGTPISIPEAAEAGRVVFGEVLRED